MRDPRFRWPNPAARFEPKPEELAQARALANRVGEERPSLPVLDEALDELRVAHTESRELFYSTLFEHLTRDATRCATWASLILTELEAVVANPDALAIPPLDKQPWRRALEAWRDAQLPLEAWGHFRGHLTLDHRAFRHLDLLGQIDPAHFAEALDLLPAPEAMQFALEQSGASEDRELIVESIERAPRIFDDQGNWLPSRSAAALLMAYQIIEYAWMLRNVVSRAPGASAARSGVELDSELEQWFTHAFGVLVARADGVQLGAVIFVELSKATLRTHAQYTDERRTRDQKAALVVLAGKLARAGCTTADFKRAWHRATEHIPRQPPRRRRRNERKRDGEGERTLVGDGLAHLYGAALVLAVKLRPQPTTSKELASFWDWARELFRGRDAGMSVNRPMFAAMQEVPQRLGSLLAHVEAPDELLQAMYTELEPQRRRTRFSTRYEGVDDDLESVLVLRVGLYAAATWCQHEAQRARAHALFWWIFAAARHLWLTVSFDRTKQDLVASCFAFVRHLFDDGLDDALQRALPPISEDPRLIGAAASLMVRNGADPAAVSESFRKAGVDLEAALRDAKQWAELIDPTGRRLHGTATGFPTDLARLAEQLEIRLDGRDDEATTKREVLVAQFERNVPWARALLDRVRHDGGTLTLLWPIETELAWLVQITVPDALRQRFGLSEELRILAVHGQVRGRTLRRATQHPQRASLVDPDLVVIASAQPGLEQRLPQLAGPWGQRVPWVPEDETFAPLAEVLCVHMPLFDVFDYRDPVRGNALVGRKEEIADISERLARGEALGVVGLRKVGKSSLLRAVAEQLDPVGARLGMFESLRVPLPGSTEPEVLVVSMDVQGLAQRTLDDLASHLSRELEERLAASDLPAPSEPTFDGTQSPTDGAAFTAASAAPERGEGLERFEISLDRALERTSASLCFMFDEYDLLFQGYGGEPGIAGAEQLFAVLRARAQSTRRVSLAFAGRDPGFFELPHIGGVTSPLPGRTKAIFLGPLRRADADELLLRLGKRTGLDVGPRTLELAWFLTGGHPLLTREFGSVLLGLGRDQTNEAAPATVETDQLCDRARQAFLSCEVVYTLRSEVEALLAARYPETLEFLASVSRGQRPTAADARHRRLLVDFGLLSQTEPISVPEVFRTWFAGFGAPLEKGA